MRHTIALSAIFAAISVVAFGAAPVGRVISNDAIEVDGITAPAHNYVPVSLGGEITTHGSPAMIQFPDGSTVSVQPNSQLKLSGVAGHPEVRMIRGSADFRMQPSALARVNTTARTVGNGANDATAQAAVLSGTTTNSMTDAFMARATSPGAVAIAPSSPIVTGGFAGGAALTGVFKVSVGGGGPSILLPSGLTMNLTPTTTLVNGVSTTTYTIASITQTVSVTETVSTPSTTPGQPPVVTTVTVQQTVTTPPPASLAAAVITVAPPASGSGSTASTLTVSTPTTVNGTTTLTPINPTTVASSLSTTVATAAQTQATATPPAGSTVTAATATVTTAPVTTGTFSPSGS